MSKVPDWWGEPCDKCGRRHVGTCAKMAAMPEPGCTVNLLGGTCPSNNLCPIHRCTEDRCYCEDEVDE